MREIPKSEVLRRLTTDNPWWTAPHGIASDWAAMAPRQYLGLFYPLLSMAEVRRAILLMGPRRVGKTVLLHHAISRLIADGVPPAAIGYVSVDHPMYNGLALDALLELLANASGHPFTEAPSYVFFDEIQYLRDWEVHLKALVDTRRQIKCVASGSAAAALRLKSAESGAGRFTDFLLPPLTFHEYLHLLGQQDLVADREDVEFPMARDITELNREFVDYLNFGGYPEVLFSPAVKADPARFIKADIIDKVLLRDLPSLYGISDIQELNALFTTLAYNTAEEVRLEELSRKSGVAKNTIRRYIEYLQAAFLIKVVHRVDREGRRFQRANFFKVYLTNPSMRAALFSPVGSEDDAIGSLAETGIFSQWFHAPAPLNYARWDRGRDKGEVDIVGRKWAVEVKWSDRYYENPHELRSLLAFCNSYQPVDVAVTTRTAAGVRVVNGRQIEFVPCSVYCYVVGRNIIRGQLGGSARPSLPPAAPAQ